MPDGADRWNATNVRIDGGTGVRTGEFLFSYVADSERTGQCGKTERHQGNLFESEATDVERELPGGGDLCAAV